MASEPDEEKALDTITFRATLAADIQSPVRPTKDFNPKTQERRTRLTFDAYLEPSLGELLLLLGEGHTLQIVVTRIPNPPSRNTLY